ncbi:D-glycero-beta-D-manno-heptose 1,7-bisphosphate 7-phosphatase [Paraferrimonas haliotis]|uniref:D,D-heptose 1,7-bisphosphate phosphatase n=1 Tax=Paraferrimonas haliotis TaxID=2013866 RepID=A0AA37TJZ4_9GAMM|nr:D-glycero-beta-D-manno-heptose 1,7-bisphosphate 7-phosphatase [Paraferrimonas haliotis]GLS82574.1 D,D-heptose 1,7-bisphosphate phosphatase [Paraferrimonas haliotis]
MKAAVFLDRDGVINHDHGYVYQVDDFHYVDGVFEACLELKKMGYLLVVVTNQSGIGRGLYSEDQFHQLTEWMDWNFVDKGVELDGIYFCPHHPKHGVGDYKLDCDCRKPKPGMLNSAKTFLNIDMSRSIMVGDKLSDMQAAEAAGVTTRILVKSGKPIDDAAQASATTVIESIKSLPGYLKGLS